MQQIHQQFKANIQAIKDLDGLYTHLHGTLRLPDDLLSDLLRTQLVNAVSALDKLVHELVQAGMIQIFLGNKSPTSKYNAFTLPMATVTDIRNATDLQPPEYFFSVEVFQRNKALSFQKPDKIADALSHIWDESHKWQKITQKMGLEDQNAVKTHLDAIVSRRNQIVHEADLDYNGVKNIAIHSDITRSVTFIENLGDSIFELVR